MIRRLTFDGRPEHRVFFRMLYEAFRSRGSAKPDTRVSKEEKRTDARILKALKQVSDPTGEEPKEHELDTRLRVLHKDGGVVDLEQPEFKRLQTYCDETQWVSVLTDLSSDLEDWLDTAAKVENDA